MFTDDQLHRYSRHIILKGFGPRAQKKLLDSSVLVIGAGGLGSPALLIWQQQEQVKSESQIMMLLRFPIFNVRSSIRKRI